MPPAPASAPELGILQIDDGTDALSLVDPRLAQCFAQPLRRLVGTGLVDGLALAPAPHGENLPAGQDKARRGVNPAGDEP